MIQPWSARRGAEEHLGIADRHLAEAADRLRHLEAAVLPRPARDPRHRALAEELLATMRRSREVMLACRRTFGKEAKVDEPDEDGP
jgi:hypothetical protein